MKRLFILLVLFSTLVLSASAQSIVVDEFGDPIYTQYTDSTALDTIVRPTQKREKPRDRWTLGVKGGFNYFFLPEDQTSPETANGNHRYGIGSDISHQAIIFSEYLFDHGLGIGAYVGNYSYNRVMVLGSSIQFGAYAHLSLLDILTWGKQPPIARRLHLLWDVGLGGSAIWQINQIHGDKSSDQVTWRAAATVRTALQLEFLIKNRWGLLLEGEYQGVGRPNTNKDNFFHSSPWINALMVSAGLRFYFDTREKESDPRLDENDLPIRKPRKPRAPRVKRPKGPKNAVYVNVNLTPEMIEEARENNGKVAVQVAPLPLSKEIDGALQVMDEQGSGTALINSIRFINDQLTPEAIQILDKIAGSLLANTKWNSADLLYVSNEHATARAAAIANYLKGKGVKNLTVKGRDAYTEVDSSDLIITIK